MGSPVALPRECAGDVLGAEQPHFPEARMSGTYKKLELVGTSPVSFAEAVKAAVAEAGKSIRHMNWFEVVEQRGFIKDGKVAEFQVTLRIGFKLEG
jgi:flavin-binding protein dodecin